MIENKQTHSSLESVSLHVQIDTSWFLLYYCSSSRWSSRGIRWCSCGYRELLKVKAVRDVLATLPLAIALFGCSHFPNTPWLTSESRCQIRIILVTCWVFELMGHGQVTLWATISWPAWMVKSHCILVVIAIANSLCLPGSRVAIMVRVATLLSVEEGIVPGLGWEEHRPKPVVCAWAWGGTLTADTRGASAWAWNHQCCPSSVAISRVATWSEGWVSPSAVDRVCVAMGLSYSPVQGRKVLWIPQSLATDSFFSISFFVKNHLSAWRANQWPLIRKTLLSVVPPSNSLVSVSDPWGAFWIDSAPFKDPQLASCVASGTAEIHGHHQVCHTRRGYPRTPSTTTEANLDCAFV